MDRAGKQARPLSGDELNLVFVAVARNDDRNKVRQQLLGRHRTTVNRAYNAAAEFERRGLVALDDKTAQQIAEKVGYSATISYVNHLFLSWKTWGQRGNHRSPVRNEAASVRYPRVIIEFDPQRPEDLGDKTLTGDRWQVACPRAYNYGATVSRACRAQLMLVLGATSSGSKGPFLLNPVDEEVTLARDTATPVDIPPGLHRSWDLVFAPPQRGPTREVISSGLVYSSSVSFADGGRASDVIDWTKGGACIGMPIAIARRGVAQAHLLPGTYVGRLELYNDSGKIAEALFRIVAPHSGGALEVTFAKI